MRWVPSPVTKTKGRDLPASSRRPSDRRFEVVKFHPHRLQYADGSIRCGVAHKAFKVSHGTRPGPWAPLIAGFDGAQGFRRHKFERQRKLPDYLVLRVPTEDELPRQIEFKELAILSPPYPLVLLAWRVFLSSLWQVLEELGQIVIGIFSCQLNRAYAVIVFRKRIGSPLPQESNHFTISSADIEYCRP